MNSWDKIEEDRRYNLLKKFRKGNIIEKDETDCVYELASIGLVRIGFTVRDGSGETASLTPLGKNMYKSERIRRNPLLEFIYSL